MEDLTKLPKWARFRIEKLEADVKHYYQKLAELSGDAETNTFIGYMNRQPLPKDETIFFYVGDIYLAVRVKEDYISLNSSENINIIPIASNAACVSFR